MPALRRFSLAAVLTLAAAPLFCQSAAPAAASTAPELRVFDPSLIDTSVDPCDNFYRFSCNNWFKRNPLPADQASYGRFTELYELNRLHLRGILEAAAVPSPARTANETEQRAATGGEPGCSVVTSTSSSALIARPPPSSPPGFLGR